MCEWRVISTIKKNEITINDVIACILENRGCVTKKQKEQFLHVTDPLELTASDVGIETKTLNQAVSRIQKAIKENESIVVYADYDADGVSAGAVLWEAIYTLGGRVMPYIPHRVDEGYGLSEKGIDQVQEQFDPTLIITVDHGITAHKQVAYAKKKGIDVIVTDHHVKPDKTPVCLTIHTTSLCGAGVAWMVAKEIVTKEKARDLLALATIGTIADMVPLVGANRSITSFGLKELQKTKRFGIVELLQDAAMKQDVLSTVDVSHGIAPRLNAMGRLEHALDALRLLCTTNADRAKTLAQNLGLKNRERQQMTIDTAKSAIEKVRNIWKEKHILIVSDTSYNQGVIGLVAGKLVEQYARPSIVISLGDVFSKGSARSITGVNIIEFIRSHDKLLVDAGGHPMAAGFTIETKHIDTFIKTLESDAKKQFSDSLFVHTLFIECELPWNILSDSLWKHLQSFAPFGLGNWEPIFCTRGVKVVNIRKIGSNQNHLKMLLAKEGSKEVIEGIGFGMGEFFEKIHEGDQIDIAFTIDMNVWNGQSKLQLKVKDIHIR